MRRGFILLAITIALGSYVELRPAENPRTTEHHESLTGNGDRAQVPVHNTGILTPPDILSNLDSEKNRKKVEELAKRAGWELCRKYAGWENLTGKLASGRSVEGLRAIRSRDCPQSKYYGRLKTEDRPRKGNRAWMQEEVVPPSALTNAVLLANNFVDVVDEFDLAGRRLSFQGVEYKDKEFIAAVLAFRLVPCEFGWRCGKDNFDVELACALQGRCFNNLSELILDSALKQDLAGGLVPALVKKFSAELRNASESGTSYFISPFGSVDQNAQQSESALQ